MAKILLVDDEPRIVTFLEKGLRRQHHQPESAFNGRQALDIALSESFDLIVLDLGLPELDGFDVLMNLRKMNQSPPVVIITALGESDCARAIELGADDCLHKPFRFGELLAKIKRLLGETEHGILEAKVG
ncbi:response regulator with CheY-like receiver domain and winged-helix DNA-binding domain [Leptolyngbya sp. PCC 7375]|nr:response regulator with CheY-like receiver domain and winged-helix DNA-binding domain [Leptolyngbya sp. PCC 7375]